MVCSEFHALQKRHRRFVLEIMCGGHVLSQRLSKIERNERKPTREMLDKLAEILKLDKDELLIQFISDKIAYEIVDEDCASKVLKVAEKKIKYLKSHPIQN